MYRFSLSPTLTGLVTEQEYKQLIDGSVDATVFNDWPWLTTAIEHLPKKHQFTAITIRDNQNNLVGFLALQITPESLHGIPARVARFVQYPLGDRISILLLPDHLAAWPKLLDYLHQLSGPFWDCMIWNEWTDSQGLVDASLHWSKRKNSPVFNRVTSHCPILSLESITEEEMSASFPSKMRTDLRRRKKKLDKLDSEILHLRPSVEQVQDLVNEMRNTEALSWKGDEGVGIFNDPETHDFFNSVSKRLAASDQLDLSIIHIDGELASYKYGFYFRNVFYDYSIGYLPQYSKLGLGRVLLNELVNSSLRNGYDAVDASRVGSVTQHLLFERTEQVTPHYRFYFFGKGLKGKLLEFVVTRLKPMLKRLREQYRSRQQDQQNAALKAEK
ncbi:hypothetical protein A9Q99_23850 [Gammaproteobacteria bacterium 45_16_T64]|nr:hypothetical protein A9Q99_23850 [Gammaproteobacteria bacterium 45_16_T64]